MRVALRLDPLPAPQTQATGIPVVALAWLGREEDLGIGYFSAAGGASQAGIGDPMQKLKPQAP
jgi:hypothetical protein